MELALSPVDFFSRARRLFPHCRAVIDGDLELDYAGFAGVVDALAAELAGRWGVSPGDRVAWLGSNTHELLAAYFAVPALGAVLVPLNIRLAPTEHRVILADCQPRVLVRHPDQAPIEQPYPEWCLPNVLASDAPPVRVHPVAESDPAEIFYTSGSTGQPKGAVLSHRSLYLHAVHTALTMGITGSDVVVHTIPLFHVNGWGTAHHLTGLGGTHIMLRRFEPAELNRLIEDHRVTVLYLVPAMAQRFLAETSGPSSSYVRAISVGGAVSPPGLLGALEDRFGCPAMSGYGMTESGPTITRALDKPDGTSRRRTTGLPILGVDARVLDADDHEVPADGRTIGEICVRSNHVMDGYLGDEAATAEALAGGWLRTGDLATVDDEGYLSIVDRRKDLIVSGGENIASVEVEHALTEDPDVAVAAVIGVPDERWGEVPVAFVELVSGSTAAAADLLERLRDRLAHYKCPREIHVLDQLPLGGTGKIQKHVLRDRLDPG